MLSNSPGLLPRLALRSMRQATCRNPSPTLRHSASGVRLGAKGKRCLLVSQPKYLQQASSRNTRYEYNPVFSQIDDLIGGYCRRADFYPRGP